MRHRKEQFIYVGVDLHKRMHTAVVINCWNEKLEVIEFENKPLAFSAVVNKVKKHVQEGMTIVFGLEDVGRLRKVISRLFGRETFPCQRSKCRSIQLEA